MPTRFRLAGITAVIMFSSFALFSMRRSPITALAGGLALVFSLLLLILMFVAILQAPQRRRTRMIAVVIACIAAPFAGVWAGTFAGGLDLRLRRMPMYVDLVRRINAGVVDVSADGAWHSLDDVLSGRLIASQVNARKDDLGRLSVEVVWSASSFVSSESYVYLELESMADDLDFRLIKDLGEGWYYCHSN